MGGPGGHDRTLAVKSKILGEKLFRTWKFPRSGSKAKDGEITPGTVGGPGGHDRTLAVKR